ncbi:MAG: hypothetical protein LQ349_006810 [Xanthoria aureola]|nr:MAG: hypothetical protein LQ349_006810 [Xanthoria aureola]
MSSHKRIHSTSSNTHKAPSKMPKIWRTPSPPSDALDPLDIANERIQDLEQQIQDLHAFINHMTHHPNAASILAAQIRSAAAEISDELSDQALNARKTGITSDDMSAAMLKYLSEVEGVKRLPQGIPIAFDLAMDLARYSYGSLDDSDSNASGYGDRPSDAVVDSLIADLALERREVEPGWDFGKALTSLREQRKHVAEYGIEGFCVGSIGLLDGWGRVGC